MDELARAFAGLDDALVDAQRAEAGDDELQRAREHWAQIRSTVPLERWHSAPRDWYQNRRVHQPPADMTLLRWGIAERVRYPTPLPVLHRQLLIKNRPREAPSERELALPVEPGMQLNQQVVQPPE